MNRLQLCKVVSVVLLACGLASAQQITTFEAPGAGTSSGQGSSGISINLEGAVLGFYADSNNLVHTFVCVRGCTSPSTFTTFEAPGAGTADRVPTVSSPRLARALTPSATTRSG
jgi:xanthine/uracil permease